MKYLFFDTECSNCFNGIGKLCEFGYVLTDENLNIIKKDVMVINPGKSRDCRFHLTGRKDQRDLVLAFEYDYYYQQEEFPYYYEKIKKLMEDKDTLCFGWSTNNDIFHLFSTCKRYSRKQFKYKCLDVQLIAEKTLDFNQPSPSLKTACDKVLPKGYAIGLQEHLSRDDAVMTMMVFKAICMIKKQSSQEVIKNYNDFIIDSTNYIQTLKENAKKKELQLKRFNLYKKIAEEDYINNQLSNYIGKRYNLSYAVIKNYDNIQLIINKVHSINGIFVNSINNTDIFICIDESNKDKMINTHPERTDIKYILLNDYLKDEK